MASREKYNTSGPLKAKNGSFKDTDMQVIIGWILRIGVVLSMVVVIVGGILFVYRHGNTIADYHVFKGVPYFIRGAGGIIQGILNFRGQAIIQAGIILLVLTPVIRVAFSAIGFFLEKDYLYTCITLLVFFIIMASMLTGHLG